MTFDRRQSDELRALLGSMEEGTFSAEGLARLDELVCGRVELLRQYIEYMRLVSDLKFGLTDARTEDVLEKMFAESGERVESVEIGFETSRRPERTGTEIEDLEADLPSSAIPSIVIRPAPPIPVSPFGFNAPLGGVLFSYAVSALLVCVGMFIGWTWQISEPDRVARNQEGMQSGVSSNGSPASKMVFVGRIGGLVNCTFAKDKDILPPPSPNAFVPLGRKYKLNSGLMEIVYDSGAKVILEGPATYEVESAAGGFLQVGKLTANVGERGEGKVASGQWPVASEKEKVESGEGRVERSSNTANSSTFSRNPEIPKFPNPSSLTTGHSPLSTLHSPLATPLFSVRTPMALITDLGTEFGVECDSEGRTRSHVFLGSVQVQTHSAGGKTSPGVVLGENESAVVEAGPNRTIQVHQEKTTENAFVQSFARRLPRRTPIQLFNTGVGVRAGEKDPHWDCIARSDDPHFKPRPALVSTAFPGSWLENDPARSQWISEFGDCRPLPHGVTHTFRTTFELPRLSSQSAVIRGKFLADNLVKAIRLNGKDVPLPRYNKDNPFQQFYQFVEFFIKQGFVEGTNTLEIDVWNGLQSAPAGGESPMGLRIEWEGHYYSQ
jgi:hypothetical protein